MATEKVYRFTFNNSKKVLVIAERLTEAFKKLRASREYEEPAGVQRMQGKVVK